MGRDLDPVLIVWADAHATDDDGWVFIDDVDDAPEYLVHTVGHLMPAADGTKHLTVAQSHAIAEDAVDHVIRIPLGMVRKIVYLTPVVP
jgi:hypothetical protein